MRVSGTRSPSPLLPLLLGCCSCARRRTEISGLEPKEASDPTVIQNPTRLTPAGRLKKGKADALLTAFLLLSSDFRLLIPKNFGWRIWLKYSMSSLRMKVLAYSKWDAVPALCGFLHFAYILTFFTLFPVTPWWALVCMGIIYSISISWNINGISHNFLHNPYFNWRPLNRVFSLMESLSLGFSQTFYKYVHHRHHMGNSDRPDDDGDTVDWLSIYRHGHDGEAENVWSYVFLSYMRDDPKAIFAEIKRKNRADAYWGVFEIVAFISFFVLLGILNWKFILFFLPFYYLGHCLSYLNGYLFAFRREPGQTHCLGREFVRKDLQFALVQQRVPRRAPFPSETALDKDGTTPYADCGTAATGRNSSHQAAARTCVP